MKSTELYLQLAQQDSRFRGSGRKKREGGDECFGTSPKTYRHNCCHRNLQKVLEG